MFGRFICITLGIYFVAGAAIVVRRGSALRLPCRRRREGIEHWLRREIHKSPDGRALSRVQPATLSKPWATAVTMIKDNKIR